VYLPYEYWEVIVNEITSNDPEYGASMKQLTSSDEDGADSDFISSASWPEIDRGMLCLERAAGRVIGSPELVNEASESMPDVFLNSEIVRMIRCVLGVLQEARLRHMAYRVWVE
jgi:hypothetical protein